MFYHAGEGGVYASVSADGRRWARPVRLLRSAVLPSWRTADHPVDTKGGAVRFEQSGGGSATSGAAVGGTARRGGARVVVTVAHQVAVPTQPERDDGPPLRSQDLCRGRGEGALPYLCAYEYAWSARRLDDAAVEVRLGEFAPWRVRCPRRAPVAG